MGSDIINTATSSVILALGAVTNIVLMFCLARTWRHWRQVRFYVILLLVGNVLDVAVSQSLTLALSAGSSIADSLASCQFIHFAVFLAPSVSAMAIAALSLHLMLTSITGNQGSRLRHGLVLGIFVLLSLPFPLMSVPAAGHYSDGGVHFCYTAASAFKLVEIIAVFFFPLLIILVCSVTAGVLFCRATVKGDEDKFDLILTYLLATAFLVTSIPYFTTEAIVYTSRSSAMHVSLVNAMIGSFHVMNCFPSIAALINIVFGYVLASQNRGKQGEFLEIPGGSSTGIGERQKLVN